VTNILQTETDNKCRLCKQFDETVVTAGVYLIIRFSPSFGYWLNVFLLLVSGLISACPILAEEQYIKRHDSVCVQLHFNICNKIGVKLDNEHWYDHVSKTVKTSCESKVSIL